MPTIINVTWETDNPQARYYCQGCGIDMTNDDQIFVLWPCSHSFCVNCWNSWDTESDDNTLACSECNTPFVLFYRLKVNLILVV